jgi:glycosidase
LLIDGQTGLPVAIGDVPFRVGIELESGGDEVRGVMGALAHSGTDRARVAAARPVESDGEARSWEGDAGEWRVRLTAVHRDEHPRLELRVAVSPRGEDELVLRDLHLTVGFGDELSDWLVEAPGNPLRPGVRVGDVAGAVSIRTAGDQLGSPGFVALHPPLRAPTLVLWPLSTCESGEITLEPSGGGLRWHLRTQLAGAVPPGEWLEHGPVYADVVERDWPALRGEISRWYGGIGVATPDDQPEWGRAVSIFEVMVGAAPFHGGHEYHPYPGVADLIDDLDRIAALGFECLQLMPRHPYPSYNIHAPGDVRTTYGEPEEIRALVDAAHRRGLRVILDVLLHGVLDRRSIEGALEVVREGPYAERLGDPCSDPYAREGVEISWARHIVEFAPHWVAGAPERHPLLDEHPDWFMRDSRGQVTGVYTQALDIANGAWQDHFVDRCEALVRELGIDGFRLDAPLYNVHANWSAATRRHASHSNLGARELLRKLRRRLRSISPELLVHTEPSGPLLRESLDVAYGYEASWLVPSLFPGDDGGVHDWRRVRNARELAAWFRDFDAAQPPGSVSAFFLDCHDTMWWRLPGDWWRRDQVGLAATKALLAVYALRGGAYMTFVGGEEGIEPELRLVHALRRHLPEVRAGAADYGAVKVGDDAVYGVLRRDGERATVVAVNLSDAPVRTACVVAGPRAPRQRAFDAWAGEWVPYVPTADGRVRIDVRLEPYQPCVLILRDPPDELLKEGLWPTST